MGANSEHRNSWLSGRGRTITIAAVALVLVLLAVLMSLFRSGGPSVPDFTEVEAGPERKEAFFNYFLPLVVERNQELVVLRENLQEYREESLNDKERRVVKDIALNFGLEDFDPQTPQNWTTLMRRVDVIPPSLALAQGANESAWGTSRFAREGNNFYGEWCFVEGCGLVPLSRDAGATHEVASFRSPRHSVENYIANLNQHSAYRELREIRTELRSDDETISGVALAAGLERYSERGEEYISELRSMIRFNELGSLDNTPAKLPEELSAP